MFSTYEHLQGLPRGDEALTMLRKVASLVKPIMRKRGLKVQILAEFLPPEQNLLGLNINRGYKICIRLRYHNNPDLFLPVEQVVDTMLHELSHNVWGEHDGNFHRLWDELRDEQETLLRKGYTGEGFLSEGKRLGGGAHVPPPHEMRRLARASAEKRQAQNKLKKNSGQRLGGNPLHLLGGDVRQVIADQVSRRNTISKGCASGRKDATTLSDQSANNTFKTKAEEDDANNRAIAQALYELMEEEEGRKLDGTFSSTPTDGGLAWHPEDGLYDPRTERLPELSGGQGTPPTEEEQMEWALQESLRSTPEPNQSGANDQRPAPPRFQNGIDRTNSEPIISPETASNPAAPPIPGQHAETFRSPISPLTPEAESIAQQRRKRPITQTSMPSPTALSVTNPNKSPIIDISEPFDPSVKPSQDQWTCEICTCINPLSFLACDACGTERTQPIGIGNRGPRPRPRPVSMVPVSVQEQRQGRGESLGWTCTGCGAFMEHRWWTCSACGRMKESS